MWDELWWRYSLNSPRFKQPTEMGWIMSWFDWDILRYEIISITLLLSIPLQNLTNLSRNISTWSHHHHHAFTCIHCSVASLSILVHHANFSHIQKSTGRFENSPLEPAIHIRKGCTNMVCFSYKMPNSAWIFLSLPVPNECGLKMWQKRWGETSALADMGYIGLPVLAILWGIEQQCFKSIYTHYITT